METQSLTYKQLAERLGVKIDSARKTVRRKGWERVQGNDGTVRISVPMDRLIRPSDCPQDSPQDSPEGNSDEAQLALVPVLEAQILGLQKLVEAERRRADGAEKDRDRWHLQATQPWWRRVIQS